LQDVYKILNAIENERVGSLKLDFIFQKIGFKQIHLGKSKNEYFLLLHVMQAILA
jgi:hypothetical protein